MTQNQARGKIAAIVVAGFLVLSITTQSAFAHWRECTGLKATATLGYAGSGMVRLATGDGADGLVSAAKNAERGVALRCN